MIFGKYLCQYSESRWEYSKINCFGLAFRSPNLQFWFKNVWWTFTYYASESNLSRILVL